MEEKKVYMNDIAGYADEKREAQKIIDVLRDYENYRNGGAFVPKGLLLSGKPGVGKTMFAKAIATEANVAFFTVASGPSDSEDDTAKSIKETFAMAKWSKPSIVFIDELDELVSSTNSFGFYGYQSDYSRKILMTLLTEIDGLSNTDGVLVIATTNSKGTIPPALIRSGRLEKQITLGLPSQKDRAEILGFYIKKVPNCDLDVRSLASKTARFTGADLKTLINEGVIESIQKNEPLSQKLIERHIPTIRFGEIRRRSEADPSDAVCYHEIGHFLVQYGLTGQIGSISVEKIGPYDGYVDFDEDQTGKTNDIDSCSADDVMNAVTVALGGIAGELVFLDKRYCGATKDISDAVDLIRHLMANGVFGFEYLPFGNHGIPSIAGQTVMGEDTNDNAPSLGQKTTAILQDELNKAIEIVEKWRNLGDKIYRSLKRERCLTREDILLGVLESDLKTEK